MSALRVVPFLAVLLTACAWAGPAGAGEVSTEFGASSGEAFVEFKITYEAAPGEANVLSIHKTQRATWIISESGEGALLTAGAGCTSVSPQIATCSVPDPPPSELRVSYNTVVDVGDMNDNVAASGACGGFAALETHPCEATIEGAEGNDLLQGPDVGDCVLRGGPGDDFLQGGRVRDTGSCLLDGGRGSDDLAGGQRGSDMVAYRDRVNPVRVSLSCCFSSARPNDGEAGEHDTVWGVSDVWTGSGDDVIVADSQANNISAGGGSDTVLAGGGNDDVLGGPPPADGPCSVDRFDRLYGGAGNDSVRGCGGNDSIWGGPGRDTFSGDRGNDTLYARDGYADSVAGGLGNDRARVDRARDRRSSIERLF